jgi:ATP-binding cassette subfamily C protein
MLMVLYSGLSIGQMLAVFGYLWLMMGPIQEILGIQYAYFSAKAALLRLNNISDLKQEPVIIESKNPFSNTHTSSLTIENLHFHYNASQPILKGVNLHIPAGHKVALVGASGGGKSTLIQILIGLYPTTQGNIYYDGVPMNQIGLNTIRENVVTVLQNPILFNDTIRANLTLGRDCPDADLWTALEISQLKTTVKGLNLALETPVGRQGLKLSGGQRQRLAIARMILSNPNIVILDEATSALDSQIENDLHNALKEFLQNRTTIIIAHRLSAVKQADHVYVFDNGQICQQGHPETLIKQKGLYAQLYGE